MFYIEFFGLRVKTKNMSFYIGMCRKPTKKQANIRQELVIKYRLRPINC